MRIFKIHKVDSTEYELTKDTFLRITRGEDPYVQCFPKELHGYAYCPGCGNPIQIVGLFVPIKGGIAPYGKHYGDDVPGIGQHSEGLYRYCRFATKMYGKCPREERKTELTEYEISIRDSVKSYYDKIIYILRESIGINITRKMAVKLFNKYMLSQGYMYPLHTVNNSPWMLMYVSGFNINPYGKCIRIDSRLYDVLSKIDGVVFEDVSSSSEESDNSYFSGKYKVLKTNKYTELSVIFVSHERKRIDDDTVDEYITMSIAHRYNSENNWIQDMDIIIDIDCNVFQRIISSSKAMNFRDTILLDMINNNVL